jgi:tRNA dimethylallyltransferase
LELADLYGVAIVSADSRQVYRHFDIGTAKPNREERSRVAHYGIDVLEPGERFSAARWANDATAWVAEAQRSGRTPLVVGGTGLYIRAFFDPLFSAPEIDAARRSQLQQALDGFSVAELRRWVSELDPPRAQLGRTQLLRAIETAVLSGRRISDMHAAHMAGALRVAPFRARYLVVDPGAVLSQRIEMRVDAMLGAGWLDEVKRLSRDVPFDAPAWKATGYGTLRRVVTGEIELSSARERVIIDTRQYAKRQRTWFRHQLPPATVTRINPDDPQASAVVREWWEKSE